MPEVYKAYGWAYSPRSWRKHVMTRDVFVARDCGFEPQAYRLTADCSTVELIPHDRPPLTCASLALNSRRRSAMANVEAMRLGL